MGITSKRINNILLFILVFFMVYDSARNYTHMPQFFGYIKDFIIYLWLFELIYLKKIKEPFSNIGFYLILILSFMWSWIGMLYPTSEYVNAVYPAIYILKQNEFFILLFVFRNYYDFFSREYMKYINLYISFSVLLLFVTLIGVYVDNPLISKTIISDNNVNMPDYANRISLGQPAIASFSQLVALFFLLLCKKKNIKNIILSALCLLSVLLSTSITGIMSSICLLIFFAVYYLIIGSLSIKIKIVFGVSAVLAFFIYFSQTDFFYNNLMIAYLFVDNRIDQFLYGTSIDPAMEARVNQTKYVIKTINDSVMGFVLGQGCNGVIIENSYYGVLLRYGVVGVLGYVIFFLSLLKKSVFEKKSLFLLSIIGIYLANWYTLDVLYIPTLSYTFSFFVMYCMYYAPRSVTKN